MKLFRSPAIITALIFFGFLSAAGPRDAAELDITSPSVSFTYPHNGASSVSGHHRTVTITFSEVMHTGYVSKKGKQVKPHLCRYGMFCAGPFQSNQGYSGSSNHGRHACSGYRRDCRNKL